MSKMELIDCKHRQDTKIDNLYYCDHYELYVDDLTCFTCLTCPLNKKNNCKKCKAKEFIKKIKKRKKG